MWTISAILSFATPKAYLKTQDFDFQYSVLSLYLSNNYEQAYHLNHIANICNVLSFNTWLKLMISSYNADDHDHDDIRSLNTEFYYQWLRQKTQTKCLFFTHNLTDMRMAWQKTINYVSSSSHLVILKSHFLTQNVWEILLIKSHTHDCSNYIVVFGHKTPHSH